MNQPFNFGKSVVSLEIPDQHLLKILNPKSVEAPKDQNQTVIDALMNPIGSKPLHEIVKPGEKIAIITSDITRPMPSKIVLPPVLDELSRAGIPDNDITIVFGLGIHRAHTEAEK